MPILDQFGRPVDTGQLREPQTARVAGLQNEFAGHPSRGLTPAKLASILEDAERGDLVRQAELGLDMEEKDGHIHAELGKRRRALLGLEWSIIPPRNPTPAEQRAADTLGEMIRDMDDLEDLILDMADAIGHGYSAIELEWQRFGAEWFPTKFHHRPPTWFRTHRQNEIRLRDNTAEGAVLNPFGWILHVHKAKPGYVTRGGLHRILSWPYLFKNYSVRDLAEFLEIYGLPLRLGTYQPGASETEKSTLLKAVVGIGHAAAGIVPEGMRIDFQEAAKGTSDPFLAMINWCERTQSKAILGQTLSAEAASTGLGSGVANLQDDVRHDILVSDARQIASTLSRALLYPIAALNGFADDAAVRMPRWQFHTQEPEDLQLFADALPKLAGVGVQIPERWARSRLQIPDPEDGEAILAAPAPVPFAGLRNNTRVAALITDRDQPVDPLADRLEIEAEDALSEWMGIIRGMVAEAPSLEALRDRLLDGYSDLPPDRLAAVMRMAMSAASLAGRYDVAREQGLVDG